MSEKKKIVLVEDNSVLSLLLKFRLEKDGHHMLMAKDWKQDIEFIENDNPDLILTDVMMGYLIGLKLISHVSVNINQFWK